MKTKKKSFVALLATFAVGTAAVAGLGFASIKSADNGLFAHAETRTVSEGTLEIGENTVNLTAGEAQTFSINFEESGIFEFEYPFNYDEEGNKVLDINGHASFTINGEVYYLNENSTVFSVELESPNTAEVVIVSDETVEFSFTVGYIANYTGLNIGSNTLDLVANEKVNCVLKGENGAMVPAGYYTFTSVSGDASFEFTYYGIGEDDKEPVTKIEVLSEEKTSFTVNLTAPNTTVIPVYSAVDGIVEFNITYSEIDPNAQEGMLVLGSNTVKATGDGIEYVFSNAYNRSISYKITCDDLNAFIMVETIYVDPVYGDVATWEWVENNTYTFTLAKDASIKFLMATNDWEDDEYVVVIERA